MTSQDPQGNPPIDWEGFYRDYRKPGFVPGYEIVHKLGGGVFGIVFKARKESIGKQYAIKFLKLDDEHIRNAVLRELEGVRHFAQVDHPNLVTIEDKGEVSGIPYIIMGYAGDETLASRLGSGPLGREQALRIFIQIARGLCALHDHSLVHFDLKPGNVFLRGEIARIGDYGLSKLISASHQSLSFGRGTPYYMAPELLGCHGDARSDIYSLGVILYECLSGEVPFRGDSEWEVLRKHEREEPRFPASITGRERQVIRRCLRKDPADRYRSVTELLDELCGESQSDVRAPSRTVSPPPRQDHVQPMTPVRRRSGGSWLVPGLVLAAILMLLLPALFFLGVSSSGHRSQTVSVRSLDRLRERVRARVKAPVRVRPSRSKLEPLAYPSGTSRKSISVVERTLRLLRKNQITIAKARDELKSRLKAAIIHGANELISLDYRDRSDDRYCHHLHDVLGPISGFCFECKSAPRRGRIPSSTVRQNKSQAEKFWHFVQHSYRRR